MKLDTFLIREHLERLMEERPMAFHQEVEKWAADSGIWFDADNAEEVIEKFLSEAEENEIRFTDNSTAKIVEGVIVGEFPNTADTEADDMAVNALLGTERPYAEPTLVGKAAVSFALAVTLSFFSGFYIAAMFTTSDRSMFDVAAMFWGLK